MSKEKDEKKIFLIGMSLLLVLVLVIGGTYAWFTLSLKGTQVNVLKAGNLSLVLNDVNSMGINQEKAVPMLDEVGEQTDPYHFTLENHGGLASEYTIYLDDIDLEDSEIRMADEKVKYSLVKDGEKTTALLSTTGAHPERVLDSGTIDGNTTITYDLRLWIDSNTGNEAMGQVVRTKIRVVAVQMEPVEPVGPDPTSDACFAFDSSTGTITDYLCVENNESGLEVITDVVIPKTIGDVDVTTIGDRAFSSNKLTSAYIPSSVTSIGNSAFSSNQLTSVTLPDTLTSFGEMAFYDNQLTEITIPSSLTEIPFGVFEKNQLASLIIPENITTIGNEAFGNNKITSLTIPSSVTSLGNAAFTVNMLPDSEAFIYNRKSDGSIDTTSINSYAGAKKSNVVIPAGVKTIGARAFQSFEMSHGASMNLQSVTIPEGVTKIDEYAFLGNDFTTVTLPNSLVTIGASAFNGNQLTTVTIPSNVTSIGDQAFLKNSFSSNTQLAKIINKTGRSFNWMSITSVLGGTNSFVTGTVNHQWGNISVTSS